MPILVPVASGADLSQGDLLKDMNLSFMQGSKPKVWNSSLALVLSRDCATEHGDRIVVARVAPYTVGLPRKGETPEKQYEAIAKVFSHLRDGDGTPDAFYLGTLAGGYLRMSAHLGELCTVHLDGDRATWLASHRVATLSDSFKRALPGRLFGAYARVGHDDTGWFCTADLEALVSAGQAYENTLRAAVSESEYTLTHARSNKPEGLHPAVEKAVTDAANALAKFQRVFAPYATELVTRRSATAPSEGSELQVAEEAEPELPPSK